MMTTSQKILYKKCTIRIFPYLYQQAYYIITNDEQDAEIPLNCFSDVLPEKVDFYIEYIRTSIDISRKLRAARLRFARWLGKEYQKYPEEIVITRLIKSLRHAITYRKTLSEAEIRQAYRQGTLGVLLIKHDYLLFQNLYTQYRHAKEKQSTILYP